MRKRGLRASIATSLRRDKTKKEHHGFTISSGRITAGNCRACHEQIYQQFLRSLHAAPSWAAIYGEKALTPDQVNFSENFQPRSTKRLHHPFVQLEGSYATTSGCEQCHSIGKPNSDGTIGTCTNCHTRHTSSVAVARGPRTCGQCHLGPDHSQIEIYEESKHGVLFNAQQKLLNLDAEPDQVGTNMSRVVNCATCHMSGLNGGDCLRRSPQILLPENFAKAYAPFMHPTMQAARGCTSGDRRIKCVKSIKG